ncbi:hypothetical protein K1T71_008289 [Dendrolimus kikuchii]|uniref:Uncharacterized protein n=1 Tax=Dendrolimus kikuchii TaxID=765133 RepID=A0ACC1CWU3_9NEOP|nr:hypothetical protein K1T71_008289 [Dendrolimus kikuchii]
MRSQASKTSPRKGDLSRTSFKTLTKQNTKKSAGPKKTKNLVNKSLAKGSKKNTSTDDSSSNKNDGEFATTENKDTQTDTSKSGPCKSNPGRSESPSKKTKKEPKEKKDPVKTTIDSVKKVVSKKSAKSDKSAKNIKSTTKKITKNNDDKKYKTKSDDKKTSSNFSKAKKVIKKGSDNQKKNNTVTKQENDDKKHLEENKNIEDICDINEEVNKNKETKNNEHSEDKKDDKKADNKIENKLSIDLADVSSKSSTSTSYQPDTPKSENERPPKFFTSIRSPRTVDIDVKCLKSCKGSLSVSERFLSMKFETKSDENIKDKSTSNTLVSQGADIDVYTFTEKVDSPKSILSDFRSPINKTVGRVRPIARVKGTIIDKKTDLDKKKYSPHRPIEEVVKQLKANKRSEELGASQTNIETSNDDGNKDDIDKGLDDKPKPIVSKSYKMVARKSSITGKPFSPIKFLDTEPSSSHNKNDKATKTSPTEKKIPTKTKKQTKKVTLSDEEIESSKFSLNTKTKSYSSSEDSISESNDDNDHIESSGSDLPKMKKTKNYKRITDSGKKSTSKELKELSKDSLIDLKDESLVGNEKPSKRRLKLLSMWSGPKKHRMASLNAIAKVHCLYENESRTHMELGLMRTIDRQILPGTSKSQPPKKKESKPKDVEKQETTSESEYETKREKKEESSESSDDSPPQRSLRGVPGIRSAGKYWDPKSSTSSSEDSEIETKTKTSPEKKKVSKASPNKSDSDSKPPAKMKKTTGVPVKKKRNRNEVVMDLKDMVVQKRMASLNATAILAASYEKRSPKSNKDDTTSDSCSDESFSQKSKNGVSSGVKSELKSENTKKESEDASVSDKKQKVEVIVNQDTDVTITGVYSTHHEGFCTVSGMQYRISSTSHTQTTATANCEKEGCPREEGSRYTPLTALSSMQPPPAEHVHNHPHPARRRSSSRSNSLAICGNSVTVPELGGLGRRAGCSSAFSAPSPSSAHHEPDAPLMESKPTLGCSLCDAMPRVSSYGYYQPAGPLIKETSAEAERSLGRFHAQPHYHAPHPTVLPQYGPYYPELCYGRYYRPPGPYHMPPPQPDAQIVGVGSEPYPPPQYYGTPPCYQHSPQRIPYVEYRGCPCPLNACPKNVLIGPATGKAPAGGGPADVPSPAHPGAAFRAKARQCALDATHDTHGSGKDPPLEPEPPAAADAPHPCPLPAIGGASPKRELYDVRDNLRIPGPVEALGPPSPARGSAGVCAPQPPPGAPRRARLGKAMARRSLAGDDTGLLITAPQSHHTLPHHSDADDDVLAISPPICAPIDLSSSDERSTPLVDVKKENEGPTYAASRKTDAQALREHNSTTVSDLTTVTEVNKAVKRRYSKPKLEIDMLDTQLEEGCKTNGIGEHVKLQKRRKVSSDQTDAPRIETVTKEPKKKSQTKRPPKTPTTEKKSVKRKSDTSVPKPKKLCLESPSEEVLRLKNVVAVVEEPLTTKPKTKSALLLDNLIRKNSVDRADAKGYASDAELNPAELFLPPNETVMQNCNKKGLNINNNVIKTGNVNGVRPNTLAAVSELIGKKLAYKNACKMEKVDSKVTNSLSVLKTPTVKASLKEERKSHIKCESNDKFLTDPGLIIKKDSIKTPEIKSEESKNVLNGLLESVMKPETQNVITAQVEISKPTTKPNSEKPIEEKQKTAINEITEAEAKECDKDEATQRISEKECDKMEVKRNTVKRCKLANGELKAKNVEKVVKLLVSKRPAIKTDEATLVVEEACASPTPIGCGRRARRRGFAGRRGRRPRSPPAPLTLQPRSPPRWSNGWNWDGEHYLSKVYLNNDSRLDRMARCWSRMSHASGDRVARGDCVLLRASLARAQPFVARVASLWENPDDGEMMVSLVWYYRPEHTERGRQAGDAPDEVFASRHRDANSVACIEDKCYVLTFNEYCRYRKRLKAVEEGIKITPSIVPPLPASEITQAVAPNDSKLPPSVSPELVLFCRKIYDFRSKKIHVPNK